MEIQKQDYYVDTILKNTKIFVQNSDYFQSLYSNLSESFYKKQFPILTANSKYSRRIYSNNEKEKEDKKNKIISLSKKKITYPIKNIKIKSFELKKINKILPLLNNKKATVFTPKFHSRNFSLNKFNNPYFLGSIPINLKKFNSNTSINFFNDYEKDFFKEIDYSNLEYNEYEIYKNKEIYEKLIKDKINYFKKEKNENPTIVLQKKFIYKKEMTLTLNSLSISFEDMALPKELNNKKLKIDLPFSLLPLFYYKGIPTFQKLLSACVKVENNFEKVYLDEDSIHIALNNIQDFENEDIKKKVDIDTIRTINDKIELLTPDFQREKIIPINLRPPILLRNNYFLKFNNFIFFWTTNTKVYITKVTLPCISLKIDDNNILIKQFIDYELLFFLYKRNFLNWEFYIIKYLSCFTKFRKLFQKLGSLNQINFTKLFLKEPKTKINTFFEEILLNIYTDQFCKNQILKFKSFYIKINFIDLHYDCEKIYHIYFTFYQYVKLYQIQQYSSKILFLIKFLDMDNETHTLNFNYEKYDNFDIDIWLQNIKKFSQKSIKNKVLEEQLYKEFEIYTKKLNIEFKKPEWSIIKFENGKEFIKTWEIGQELEIELVDSILHGSSKSWTNLLNECLKKLNEPVPEIQNTLSNLSFKKKIKWNKSHKSNTSSSDTYKKSKNTFLISASKK